MTWERRHAHPIQRKSHWHGCLSLHVPLPPTSSLFLAPCTPHSLLSIRAGYGQGLVRLPCICFSSDGETEARHRQPVLGLRWLPHAGHGPRPPRRSTPRPPCKVSSAPSCQRGPLALVSHRDLPRRGATPCQASWSSRPLPGGPAAPGALPGTLLNNQGSGY